MNSNKKQWVVLSVLTVLAVGGASTAIYYKNEEINQTRDEIAKLESEIGVATKTIEKIGELEQEVIVLRELSGIFEQILPSAQAANELIQVFYRYSDESAVEPSSFKSKPQPRTRGRSASAFDKFSYTLTMSGDTFQFLDFMNRVETHSRFLSVPSFKLSSASRQDMEKFGTARHKIQLDVETYVYQPTTDIKRVGIDGYERKRDLLAGEINRRRQALTLSTFNYRGARGRRDPWIDPRVPVEDTASGLTVAEQNEKVDELVALYDEAEAQWNRVNAAQNILERMMEKKALIETMGEIDDELRRVELAGSVTFTPAAKRLSAEVREPLAKLRSAVEETSNVRGPSKDELEQIADSMRGNLEAGEFELALQSFSAVSSSLDLVQGDPVRMELALVLRRLNEEADILREFDGVDMSFGGQVLIEDRPPAVMLNGKTLSIGDMLQPGLEIIGIRPNEVEFAFRGVVLTKTFAGGSGR